MLVIVCSARRRPTRPPISYVHVHGHVAHVMPSLPTARFVTHTRWRAAGAPRPAKPGRRGRCGEEMPPHTGRLPWLRARAVRATPTAHKTWAPFSTFSYALFDPRARRSRPLLPARRQCGRSSRRQLRAMRQRAPRRALLPIVAVGCSDARVVGHRVTLCGVPTLSCLQETKSEEIRTCAKPDPAEGTPKMVVSPGPLTLRWEEYRSESGPWGGGSSICFPV